MTRFLKYSAIGLLAFLTFVPAAFAQRGYFGGGYGPGFYQGGIKDTAPTTERVISPSPRWAKSRFRRSKRVVEFLSMADSQAAREN